MRTLVGWSGRVARSASQFPCQITEITEVKKRWVWLASAWMGDVIRFVGKKSLTCPLLQKGFLVIRLHCESQQVEGSDGHEGL